MTNQLSLSQQGHWAEPSVSGWMKGQLNHMLPIRSPFPTLIVFSLDVRLVLTIEPHQFRAGSPRLNCLHRAKAPQTQVVQNGTLHLSIHTKAAFLSGVLILDKLIYLPGQEAT